MSFKRRILSFVLILGMVALLGIQSNSQVVGKNVNMVSGTKLPGGDPFLQRQNEPSLAVSTRNPMHLLAGANDYRTVDMPHPNEYIPNYSQPAQAAYSGKDAWLGVFKSLDGGESWFSTLLPGFPQDNTYIGRTSPLYGYGTAADPVVRAGTNGLFYYSGIVFNRSTTTDPSGQQGAVFIARFIDNNDQEAGDPIQYVDTTVIHEEFSGRFIDKPWIAVDIPRSGNSTVRLQAPDVPAQQIAKHSVYLAYTLFEGSDAAMHSTIYIVRSGDCGKTWSSPVPISGGNTLNQGAVLAINPENGKVYVAWRRFATETETDAILVVSSTPDGKTFNPPVIVQELLPFDQITKETVGDLFSFRTNSYPTMAVDDRGMIHLAWSQRTLFGENYPSRIVHSTSTNGRTWSVPRAVDHCSTLSHQFMPSLAYAGGRLLIAWYDQRDDLDETWGTFIEDSTQTGLIKHTLDLRVAMAETGKNPVFGESRRLTKFLHMIDPEAYDDDVAVMQYEYHFANLPLFKQGTAPFLGDYIDVAVLPFIRKSNGKWTPNDDPGQAVFHGAWADNRDVIPPPDNNWQNYSPPNSDQDPEFASQNPDPCDPDRTGMRNQNTYTATISGGLIVGSPGNAKPLNIQRAFVVYVKNDSEEIKTYRLTIEPGSLEASFLQFEPLTTLDVDVAPFSSIARNVYVSASSSTDSVRVNIEEVGGTLSSYVILNGDPTNPNLRNPNLRNEDPSNPNLRNPNLRNAEVYNPNLRNPNLRNENISNTNLINPNLRNTELQNTSLINPNLRNEGLLNPNLRNTYVENPNLRNDHIYNPNLRNETVLNPNLRNAGIDESTWIVRNDGNTTTSYMMNSIAAEGTFPDNIYLQLLIYKVHRAPTSDNCTLKEEHHDELLLNISEPLMDPSNPNLRNPNLRNPDIRNASFWLAPGEEAYITIRAYADDATILEDIAWEDVEVSTVAQSVSTEDAANGITDPAYASSELMVMALNLPKAYLNQSYNAGVAASGGTPLYSWTEIGGILSTYGLSLNGDGSITGVPSVTGPVTFTAQVTDSSLPSPGTAQGSYTILIVDPLIITTTYLPDGTKNKDYSATLGAAGGTSPFTWTLAGGALPDGLKLDTAGTIFGKPNKTGIFTFSVQAVDSSLPTQTAVKTLSISVPEITEAWMVHYDGGFSTSEIVKTVNDGVLDGSKNLYLAGKSIELSHGGSSIYVIKYDNSGTPLWERFYNQEGLFDEGLAIALDSLDNVYVAGYVETAANGKDYVLLKYDKDGNFQWSEFYDGPGHRDDEAVDIAIDTASDYIFITGTIGLPEHPYICTIGYDTDGDEIGFYPVMTNFVSSGVSNQYTVAMELDGAGYLYVAGTTNHLGSEDFFVQKYNAVTGATVLTGWPVFYDGGATDRLTALKLDGTNVIVTGMSDGAGGGMDYATVKYSSSGGSPSWSARFDGYGYHDMPQAMTVDSGNIYVTGRSDVDGGSSPLSNYGTVAYDSSGVEIWKKFYDGPAAEQDVATAIDVASGYLYVSGYSDGEGTGFDFALVQYDSSDGQEMWVRRYDHISHYDDSATVMVLDGANPIISGNVNDQGDDDIATLCYDDDGNEVWGPKFWGASSAWGDPSRGLSVDAAGNIYASGPTYVLGNNYDMCLTKFDRDGNELWTTKVNGPADAYDWTLFNVLDGQGNIYLGGQVWGASGSYDFGVAKLDVDGNTEWYSEKDLSSNRNDFLRGMAVDSSGNLYAAGRSDGGLITLKYNSATGEIDWSDQISEPSGAYNITVDSAGYIYSCGWVMEISGDKKPLVVKYDSDGNQLWAMAYHSPVQTTSECAYDVAVDGEGNVYITGTAYFYGSNDIVTVKYDSDGNMLWSKNYDGPYQKYDSATEIELDASGNVIVLGTSPGDGTSIDIVLLKYDSDGNQLWSARYDGPDHLSDSAQWSDSPLAVDASGNVYATFISNRTGIGDTDAVMLMYDPDGNLVLSKTYDSEYHRTDNAHAIVLDPDGNIIVSISSLRGESRGDRTIIKYIK